MLPDVSVISLEIILLLAISLINIEKYSDPLISRE